MSTIFYSSKKDRSQIIPKLRCYESALDVSDMGIQLDPA